MLPIFLGGLYTFQMNARCFEKMHYPLTELFGQKLWVTSSENVRHTQEVTREDGNSINVFISTGMVTGGGRGSYLKKMTLELTSVAQLIMVVQSSAACNSIFKPQCKEKISSPTSSWLHCACALDDNHLMRNMSRAKGEQKFHSVNILQ